MTTNIVWFQNDLRLHDNPAVAAAEAEKTPWVGVCIESPHLRGTNRFGDPLISPHQKEARKSAVRALAEKIREKGGVLVTSDREPSSVLESLSRILRAKRIFSATEAGTWEHREMTRTSIAVRENQCHLIWTRVGTALEPLAVSSCQDTFTPFARRLKECNPKGAQPLPPSGPEHILGPSEEIKAGVRAMLSEPTGDGDGENNALAALTCWINGGLRGYKSNRNRLEGGSSGLSTALALGTLSARTAYAAAEAKIRDRSVPLEEGTKFLSELLWRDFFIHMGLKHGARLYMHRGITGASARKPVRDPKKLRNWKDGTTGQNLIDAFMRELKSTGFMSNRGRQIVASYLINELGQPWEDGAWWFQATLIDHSPTQNWGNWLHASGNGTDPVPDRKFNPFLQAEKFDPDGTFQKKWLC
jgi:deoxyribodipyrimidine photo-lyase